MAAVNVVANIIIHIVGSDACRRERYRSLLPPVPVILQPAIAHHTRGCLVYLILFLI